MNIERLKQIINSSKNIVFMTGAGISTASNIPDFRSSDGLYHMNYKYPPEEILSLSFFNKNPEVFYEFYKSKMIYKDALPNKAHLAIKVLSENKNVTVITQNIDGLHSLSNSNNILELHGSVYKNHCIKCHKFFDIDYILSSSKVPLCDKCGGIIKPDVILYEEQLDMKVLDKSINALEKADLLIVAGTSLTVNPAASLVRYFRGKCFIIINKSSTPYDDYADVVIRDNVEDVLSFILEESEGNKENAE